MAFLNKPTRYIGKRKQLKQRPYPEYSKPTLQSITQANIQTLAQMTGGSKLELESIRSVLAQLIYSATYRVAYGKTELEFDLTINQLVDIYIRQQGRCYYSGRRMDIRSGAGNTSRARTNPNKISLDRVDSERGYTFDNVVLCCWAANQAKATLSVDDFLELCLDIALYTSNAKC